MNRLDVATEVKASFDQDGKVQVLSFSWGGSELGVTARGRTWMDDDGRHVLVMVSGERVFELVLRRSDLTWRVVGRSPWENVA